MLPALAPKKGNMDLGSGHIPYGINYSYWNMACRILMQQPLFGQLGYSIGNNVSRSKTNT